MAFGANGANGSITDVGADKATDDSEAAATNEVGIDAAFGGIGDAEVIRGRNGVASPASRRSSWRARLYATTVITTCQDQEFKNADWKI
jgi:DNA-binding cell septation regulator SpoVG